MQITQELLKELTELRKELHRHPEISNQEEKTAHHISKYLKKYKPDQIIKGIGGNGVAAVYNGKEKGDTVVLRCELDALPIEEKLRISHNSKVNGISHKCGHDGHMAIIAGMAALLHKNKPKKGKVVLLFQPAEETGEGALQVKKDPKFKKLKATYIFGLHNLPGYQSGNIILKNDVFASASHGMVIYLKGATSHAAHPENGKSPAAAMADIIHELNKLNVNHKELKDYALSTIVHAKLGELAFGTMPGEARIYATLRAFYQEDLDKITKEAQQSVKEIASKYRLKQKITFEEIFPSTMNDDEAYAIVNAAAKNKKLKVKKIRQPFRWSEDFGHYNNISACFFGIGAGVKHAQLHNEKYDFPDKIISQGLKIMSGIVEEVNG